MSKETHKQGVHLYVATTPQWKEIEAYAHSHNMTASSLIHTAVHEYIAKH